MLRQLLILFLIHFLFLQNVVAVPPTDKVLTLPSDEPNINPVIKDSDKSGDILQDQGLDQTNESASIQYPTFHLKPSPSFTIQMSSAHEFESDDTNPWFGVHLAPWMTATRRIQLGIDVYDRFGWLQAAYHVLPSRAGTRFFWGGGLSSLVDTREDLRPLLKLKNYYVFAVGGLDVQILDRHSLRFEASYHQSTEFSIVRGTVGFSTYF